MRTGKFKRWIQIDWDAIAGIIAALIAIVMHYLHALEVDVLLMITLVLPRVIVKCGVWENDHAALL